MNIFNLTQKPGNKIIFSKTLQSHVVINEMMQVLYSGNMVSCLLFLNQSTTKNLTYATH